MKQLKTPKFDVAIIGAGASGCVAAEQLCSQGLKVAILDAGSADGSTKKAWAKKLLHYSIQKKSEAFSQENERFFVKDSENPYSFSARHPFYWIRSRALGGRLNLWTGECYRMSELDFKANSRDGIGAPDWPLDYDELDADYEKAEQVLKIHGHKDGIGSVPDGKIMRAPELDANESFVQEKLKKRGIPVVLDRMASSDSSKPPNLLSLIHRAEKTGNLTYYPDSVIRSLKRGKDGYISSAEGVSTVTKKPLSVSARSFVLCASTLESTRILMNSHFKNIRGEKVLGRYLNDHIGGPKCVMVRGFFPFLSGDGANLQRKLYIPRYQNLGTERTWPFRRGFSTRVILQRLNPFFMGFALTSFGEMPPYFSNRVELSGRKKDNWGTPALKVRFALHENERRMFEYMKWDLTKMAETLTEGKNGRVTHSDFNLRSSGLCNHEVGTVRMGEDPKESFLNSYCRSHDIENLYVPDGSSFPSLGTANPTLTIMALTYRACTDLTKRV